MAYETIKYEVAEQILTITLNRPDKLNAFNAAMQRELIEAFDAADKDDNVRAIIVTGAGRGFCAGADLSSGADTFDRDARRGPVKRLPSGAVDYSDPNVRDGGGQVTLRIFKCLKPVIAAVNGAAVGIGVTMQLAMDIRIASEAARFGFVFSQRGIVPLKALSLSGRFSVMVRIFSATSYLIVSYAIDVSLLRFVFFKFQPSFRGERSESYGAQLRT